MEDVRGGDLNKDWKPLHDLSAALNNDGYNIYGGQLSTVTKPEHPGRMPQSSTLLVNLLKESSVASQPDRRTVFLVHGRDVSARESLVQLLRAFDLRVIDWRDAASEAGGGTPYTGDIVAAGMKMAAAVVVLLTPDDVGYVRTALRDSHDGRDELQPTGQARLNVVFEAGMAMALDRQRVVMVEVGRVRHMSDTAGVNVIRLHDGIDRRKDLAARLKAAGLAVDDREEEWRTAGKFNKEALSVEELMPPVAPATPSSSSSADATDEERRVLALLYNHFSQNGKSRLNTPFAVPGLEWNQVEVILRDLADSNPPYIKGISAAQADYPIVITGLTERGRTAAR